MRVARDVGTQRRRTAFWADSINVVGGAPAAAVYGDGGGPLMPVGCSGIRGMSWEVWEAKTPMVVEQADFAPDSAGAGRYPRRPGHRLRRERAAIDMDLTVVNERSQVPPFALVGGQRGRRNEVDRPRSGRHRSRSTPRSPACTCRRAPAIEVHTGGGAGYGPPEERSPQAVRADVAAGYLLTAEGARRQYPHAFAAKVEV